MTQKNIPFQHARVSQVRIARPTDRLEEVVTFYRDGLGMGYSPVDPQNQYWRGKSVTFEDPDRWRVVLCNGRGI